MFLKDSYTLIKELKHLQLLETARIFTADAKSMYTNIDTTMGLGAIKDFLDTNKEKLPTNFPRTLFLQVLEIVMRNNIFSFADTYRLQLLGTAMGTPAACAYATLTFGHFENTTLLPEFQDNLIYYYHYIDDVFGIWLPPVLNKSSTWTNFKNTMNSWGNLKWSIEELNRYWWQNSTTNFQELTKFIERLHARGHLIEILRPIFTQTAAALDGSVSLKANTDTSNTPFIHWTHHPNGMQCSDIPQIYNQTLQTHNIHDRMVVAISRPKNLRDILTKTMLSLPNGMKIQGLIAKLSNN
jgi:hypothetical protein